MLLQAHLISPLYLKTGFFRKKVCLFVLHCWCLNKWTDFKAIYLANISRQFLLIFLILISTLEFNVNEPPTHSLLTGVVGNLMFKHSVQCRV